MRTVLVIGLFLLQAQLSAATVVASTSIVADWVDAVAGDAIELHCLVPRGNDPHAYRPPPKSVAQLAGADLVVHIGGGVVPQLDQILKGHQGAILRLAGDDSHEADETEHHGHDHAGDNPHIWHDITQVRVAVARIRDALIALEPSHQATFEKRAAAYDQELQDLDQWIRQQVATIPSERRILISSHNAFDCFAEAYGFTDTASVLGSQSTEVGDPSPRQLGALITRVKAQQVPALFPERGHDSRLLAMVAKDAGIPLAEPLGAGSLGPEGSADGDYLGFMRRNVTIIVAALR
ncbi:MAG: metal ABC transporter substrate-binding protein [Planctomycetota bacterium]|jgi:ABC-type Zn uptake system ZnuABC Zn-binding protein ZnuA|nr:metal ABC transporter substrate-binding protein [Planctomycetota bacterium]